MLKVCFVIDQTTSGSPPNATLRVKLGGTNVFVSGTGVLTPASTTSRSGTQCVPIQGTAAAGASVTVEAGGLFQTGSMGILTLNTLGAVSGINTTGTLSVQISWQWAAATAGNNVILRQMWVMAQ